MDELSVPIQSLQPVWHNYRVTALDILRLDMLHPIISGNKWYKLKYNLQAALNSGSPALLTFGGGYSNHLAATAYACHLHQLPAVGIVRGNYPVLTPTLLQCRQWGMELRFVSSTDYQRKNEPGFIAHYFPDLEAAFMVPEGGDNELGRRGASLIAQMIPSKYSHIVVSCGTGTTLAGIRQGKYLASSVAASLTPEQNTNWTLHDDWHFGGFGKHTPELIQLMNNFFTVNGIELDVVYTAKMMAGLSHLLQSGYFRPSDRILCIHTGGLQGNASVANQLIWQQ
ncbi:MAG: pyridoxal-phosphate dependent enzyme [Chitinophagia bacterium]|nr:pyridoxal-phosphate dependent enzyme [Chitinophagia bacterium]